MSDELMEAGLDHKCKDKCTGWTQGFERGQFDMRAEILSLKAEIEGLKTLVDSIFEINSDRKITDLILKWVAYRKIKNVEMQ